MLAAATFDYKQAMSFLACMQIDIEELHQRGAAVVKRYV